MIKNNHFFLYIITPAVAGKTCNNKKKSQKQGAVGHAICEFF